jgi:hypothetical protein
MEKSDKYSFANRRAKLEKLFKKRYQKVDFDVLVYSPAREDKDLKKLSKKILFGEPHYPLRKLKFTDYFETDIKKFINLPLRKIGENPPADKKWFRTVNINKKLYYGLTPSMIEQYFVELTDVIGDQLKTELDKLYLGYENNVFILTNVIYRDSGVKPYQDWTEIFAAAALSPFFTFKYISYELDNNGKMIKKPIYQENKGFCYLTIFLDVYKDEIRRVYKSEMGNIDIPKLYQIATENEYYEGCNGALNFKQVKKIFKMYSLGLYIFDINGVLRLKYEPPSLNKKINPPVLYLVLKDNHVEVCNFNILRLQQIRDNIVNSIEFVGHNYRLPDPKFTNRIFSVCEKLEDIYAMSLIVKEQKQNITMYYNNDLSQFCYEYIQDSNVIPKIIFNEYGMLSMTIFIDNYTLSIIKEYPRDGTLLNYDNGTLNLYNEWSMKVQLKLLNKNFKSTYNDDVITMFKTYKRANLIGSIPDNDIASGLYKGDFVDGYDFNKYYTSILYNMRFIPVFSYFCRFENYNRQPIDDYTLYLVKVDEFSMYCSSQYSLCYGINLSNFDMKYEIISLMRPAYIVPCNFKGVINDLWNTKLCVKSKKNIMNIAIGMTGKSTNKRYESNIFTDEKEALYHKNETGGEKYMEMYTPKDSNGNEMETKYYHIVTNKYKKHLQNGFYPIQLMIYDCARMGIYSLAKKLQKNGEKVLGCNTDCVFVASKERGILPNKDESINSLGKYRIETHKMLPKETLTLKKNVCIYTEKIDIIKKVVVKDEFNLTDDIKKYNRLLILGDYPGVGKSTSVLKTYKKLLIVTAWNSLKQEWHNNYSSATCITVFKFFGTTINDDGSENTTKTYKAFDYSDFDAILFDEIYLYNEPQLERIAKFDFTKPIYATGDINQLGNPQKSLLNTDLIIKSIFKNVLTLKIPKRTTGERMKKICDEIKKCENVDEARAVVLKNFKHTKKIADTYNITFLKETAAKVSNVLNDRKTKEKGVYRQGDYLFCIHSRTINVFGGKKIIHSGYTYLLLEKKGYYTLQSDDSEFIIEDKKTIDDNFIPAYAFTCHSRQGFSVSKKYTIFDINHKLITKNWLLTAITRTTDVDNVSIFVNDEKFDKCVDDLDVTIEKKIQGHLSEDIQKNRITNNDNYVTVEYVKQLLEKQYNTCANCLDVMSLYSGNNSTFSIQRIDNNLPHIIGNVCIMCIHCNKSLK